jgi:tetratricopeptide (TPR) repeat protein
MRSWMLGLAVVLATTPAVADDKAKAKALYDEGLRHFQVAEYTQAIDAWKQSYLLSKKPLLLFNIGQAYRLSGDCKQAITFYDNYQDAEPNPKNQDELDQAVAACKVQGDKPAATNPTTTNPTTTNPTTTNPTTTTANPTETKPVETKPGESKPGETRPQLDPAWANTKPIAPEHSSGGGHRTLGLALAIGGGVLEAGAIYFALDGKSKSDDVANATTWDQKTIDTQNAGQRDNKLAIGLGVVGTAALVTGVVFLVTGGHAAETNVASDFKIAPTRDGAQIGWSHAF